MCVQYLKFLALPDPEIIGGTNFGHVYAHAPFTTKFLTGFCSDGPVNVLAKFEVRSLIHPFHWIIAIGVLSFWVGVANPNLGEEEAVGGRG